MVDVLQVNAIPRVERLVLCLTTTKALRGAFVLFCFLQKNRPRGRDLNRNAGTITLVTQPVSAHVPERFDPAR